MSMRDKIESLLKMGKQYNDIAKELKCAKSTVSYHAKKLGYISPMTIKTGNFVECNNCSKKTYRTKSTRRDNVYCSRKCYSDFNTKNFRDNLDKLECTSCKVEKDKSEFYKNSTGNLNHYCKICLTEKTLTRQRKVKEEAVEYKGGKCERCGYNKYIGALQFHHVNPEEKDPKWNNYKLRKFDDKFKEELDKCMLVCSNCHSEIHYENYNNVLLD